MTPTCTHCHHPLNTHNLLTYIDHPTGPHCSLECLTETLKGTTTTPTGSRQPQPADPPASLRDPHAPREPAQQRLGGIAEFADPGITARPHVRPDSIAAQLLADSDAWEEGHA